MRLRNSIYLSVPSKHLRQTAVEDGWFDDSSTNWKLGFGRGMLGALAHRNQFLTDIKRNDLEVKVIGITKGITPVGYATVTPISVEHKTSKLFIFLAKEYRGKLIGPTVLYKLLDLLFRSGIHRVEIEVLSINKSARKWLRHSGLKQECIKLASHWMENSVFNTILFRVIKPDFNKEMRL